MPWGDWQFWVVSVLAVVAGWFVIRPFVRRRKRRPGQRVDLTVGRKRV